MEGHEGNHGDEFTEIRDEEALLGGTLVPPAAVGGETSDGAVMPVADVMALLQAMREEQLDSLKRIADGVQQLQSQVMVLGESASASEGNTSMVLSRLAALEVRIGSAPAPLDPRDKTPAYQVQPQTQQDARAGGRVGRGVAGTGGIARIPAFAATAQAGSSPPVAGKVPLPPAAAFSEPGRAPTWQGRADPEPARTHFMRTASPHAGPPPATNKPFQPAGPTQAAARAVAGGVEGARRGEGDAEFSKEAARKEAKRLAFMEDRARIQARISATKGGGEAPAGAKPAPTSANPPTEKLGVVQTQPLFDSLSVGPPAAGLSSPFATPGGGAGVFSSSASFLDDEGNQARTGADDEGAAWLEREKEQRERRERARREEEERVERQRAEAKRLKEEERARKVREAEEARARDKARREAEAKKQAKTRVLMSSLFDKGDEDDGNSLFGGLGGAALPVFVDESNDYNDSGSGTDQAAKHPVAPASSVSAVAPPPLSSGGGLFGSIEEPTAASRGGKPGSPFLEQFSSPVGEVPPARKGVGTGLETESSGLFDSLPPPSQASNNHSGSNTVAPSPNDGITDEMDDFLSTLETPDVIAPSGGGTSGTDATRGSIFGDDEFAGGGNDDGIFSSLPTVVGPNRGSAGQGAAATQSGAGTSLFERTEFSIESEDDEGGNVFGGGVGGVGGAKGGGGDNYGASFMSAMEEANLSLSGDDGKPGEEGADKEGMVDVTF